MTIDGDCPCGRGPIVGILVTPGEAIAQGVCEVCIAERLETPERRIRTMAKAAGHYLVQKPRTVGPDPASRRWQCACGFYGTSGGNDASLEHFRAALMGCSC